MTAVPPTNPDEIEQAVSAHLAKALDGQRGRAAAAFRRRMMSLDMGSDADTHSFARAADARAMRTLKIWAGAASALAACLAVLVTLQVVSRTGGGGREVASPDRGSVRVDPNLMNVNAPMMDQVELSRDVDGGTAMLPDNTPVRVVRQQTLRQTQWFDPNDKATYRVTEPGEQVGYVRMQPY